MPSERVVDPTGLAVPQSAKVPEKDSDTDTKLIPSLSSLHQVKSSNSIRQIQSAGLSAADFKPSARLYVAFLTLAVITLMVALDGTSLSVALPVRSFCFQRLGH